jgi:hypothetical protein
MLIQTENAYDNRLRCFAVHVGAALGFGRQFADGRQALIDGRR